MKFLLLTILFRLIISAHGQPTLQADTCYKLKQQAESKKMPGSYHSRALHIANGIIVSVKEIEEEQIDSIRVIECPESFDKFGDLAALGVVWFYTKHKFESIMVADIVKIKLPHLSKSPKTCTYALNGYFFSDTSLQISKKAIVRVDVINNNDIHCISIWTMNESEINEDKSWSIPPYESRIKD